MDTSLQTLGILSIALYFLIKGGIVPLVGAIVKNRGGDGDESTRDQIGDRRRLNVLEIDITAAKAQIVDLKELLNQYNGATAALDEKMDVILAEFADVRRELAEAYRLLGERLTRAETHIEHILRTPHGD